MFNAMVVQPQGLIEGTRVQLIEELRGPGQTLILTIDCGIGLMRNVPQGRNMPDAADLPDDRWTWEAAATRADLAGQLDATRNANLFSLFRQRLVSSVAEITRVIAAIARWQCRRKWTGGRASSFASCYGGNRRDGRPAVRSYGKLRIKPNLSRCARNCRCPLAGHC